MPALERISLAGNPFGDEGFTALVAPPPLLVGAPPPPTGVLTKLKQLALSNTQVADAGCAAFASALDNGALPALERSPDHGGTPASPAAKKAVAVPRRRAALLTLRSLARRDGALEAQR